MVTVMISLCWFPGVLTEVGFAKAFLTEECDDLMSGLLVLKVCFICNLVSKLSLLLLLYNLAYFVFLYTNRGDCWIEAVNAKNIKKIGEELVVAVISNKICSGKARI